MKVEIPGNRNRRYGYDKHHFLYFIRSAVRVSSSRKQCQSFKFQLVPLPSFIGAAEFGIVIQLSETLVKLSLHVALLQVRHGQFVLLLNKGLTYKRREWRDETWKAFWYRNSFNVLKETNTYHGFCTVRVFQPCVGIINLCPMVVFLLLQGSESESESARQSVHYKELIAHRESGIWRMVAFEVIRH